MRSRAAAINVATTCDDSNPCTTDACSAATGCTHTNNTITCDDGNVCTQNDTCAGGTCVGGVSTCDCQVNADCGPRENGNFCDGTLICQLSSHTCVVNPATIITCDASGDTTCAHNTCTPGTGACVMTAQNTGAACNADNNVCTPNDVCQGTSCVAAGALNCDDGNPCTNDACDALSGCTHTNNNASCSDGNACTVGDVCNGGACAAGAAATCNDGNICTTDSCNAATGSCVFAPVVNGTTCDADGSVCTVSDSCQAGSCTAGTALACDDAKVCTTDGCNATTGCTHVDNTLACNDGNACTSNDTCAGGTCAGTATTCNDSNACTTDACVPPGGCVYTNVTNGTGCGAGNICVSGQCVAGVCGDGVLTAATGETCDDGNKTNGDGCSSTCKQEGCADGTRENVTPPAGQPKIAACSGNFTGTVNNGASATALCQTGWHICSSSAADKALLATITAAQGAVAGCWVMNASNRNGTCTTCTDQTNDMRAAAVGGTCGFESAATVNSCTPNAGTDGATQTQLGCSKNNNAQWAVVTGVLCCSP